MTADQAARAAVSALGLATRATEVENLAVRVERLEQLAQEAGLSLARIIDVGGAQTTHTILDSDRGYRVAKVLCNMKYTQYYFLQGVGHQNSVDLQNQ